MHTSLNTTQFYPKKGMYTEQIANPFSLLLPIGSWNDFYGYYNHETSKLQCLYEEYPLFTFPAKISMISSYKHKKFPINNRGNIYFYEDIAFFITDDKKTYWMEHGRFSVYDEDLRDLISIGIFEF